MNVYIHPYIYIEVIQMHADTYMHMHTYVRTYCRIFICPYRYEQLHTDAYRYIQTDRQTLRSKYSGLLLLPWRCPKRSCGTLGTVQKLPLLLGPCPETLFPLNGSCLRFFVRLATWGFYTGSFFVQLKRSFQQPGRTASHSPYTSKYVNNT